MTSQNGRHAAADSAAKEKVDHARSDIADAAEESKRAAQEAAGSVQQAATDQAEEAAHEAKTAAAGSATRVAKELEEAAARCSEDDTWAQGLLKEGASSLRTASGYLSGNRVDELLRDGEAFARNNPAAYLGASIAAGFMLARVGKVATARATGTSANRQSDNRQSENREWENRQSANHRSPDGGVYASTAEQPQTHLTGGK